MTQDPLADIAPMPAESAIQETPWLRLDTRMIVVRPLHDAVGLLPVLAAYLIVGSGHWQKLAWSGAAIVLLLLIGLTHWMFTKYRITDEQVQLHTGLISRKQLAVRTDRIRTVETTAKFGHRMFGLAAVRIGTGQQVKEHSGELKLDAITKTEAERLRLALLRRTAELRHETPPATQQSTVDSAAPAAEPEQELATVQWAWLRFAPLTLTGLAAVAAGVGILFRALNEAGGDPSGFGPVKWALHIAERNSVLTDILIVLAVILVVLTVGGLIGYVIQFWNYRLTREPDKTLRITRGLLTKHSVSIEEARLRGILIREPLLLRIASGARTDVISTGMSKKGESTLLVPPAPRTTADSISSDALRAADSPTTTALRRHPMAALRRRLTRSLGFAVIVVLVLFVANQLDILPAYAWQLALILLPLMALLGWDRYRSLGHALTDRYLVTRSKSMPRDTATLQRTGIVGWNVRSSFFQRRSGLVTLTATTAAGSGGYHVVDVDALDGIALADEATPGLLTPFLR